MATIKVLGGDIPPGKWTFMFGTMSYGSLSINLATSTKSVEVQTEEKLKKLAGSAGWGFVGGIIGGLLGGVGALAGLAGGVLSGGNKTEICFSCELTNDQKFIAITDIKTYQAILGYSFSSNTSAPRYIPTQETIENFKQQIAKVLDPTKTTCTLKVEKQGWILVLNLKNQAKFSKQEQVNLIKKAIENTQFGGIVSIRVNKISPNTADDKEWKAILNYNNINNQVVELNLSGCLYILIGFVSLALISNIFQYISLSSKIPRPSNPSTVQETTPNPPSSSRTYIGTSRFGYSLWQDGTCLVVTGVRESDLRRRFNTDLSGFRQAIKDETRISCVLIE